MINKNWKFLSGTTLSLLMSAVVIAPASAEYVAQELQPGNSMEQRESVGKKETKVGQIQSISGSTVTVKMQDGMTQEIETSSSSMSEGELAEGSYVLIDDNAIVGAVERGTIRSVTNSVAEVELEDGDVITLDISQDLAANTEIKAGAEVFVANNEIIAPAESMTSDSMEDSSDDTSTGAMETETTTPTQTGTYESQTETQTGTYESQTETTTPTQTGTYESQDDTVEDTQTEESQEPVRGMW